MVNKHYMYLTIYNWHLFNNAVCNKIFWGKQPRQVVYSQSPGAAASLKIFHWITRRESFKLCSTVHVFKYWYSLKMVINNSRNT